MIKKTYYVKVNGKELLCDQLYSEMQLMLAETGSYVQKFADHKRRKYYNLAEDLMNLLLELQEGSKEIPDHIDNIKEFYQFDEMLNAENTPEILCLELEKIFPCINTYLDNACKRTLQCRDLASAKIKKENDRITYSEMLEPAPVVQCTTISMITGKQKAKEADVKYPAEYLDRENTIAKFVCCLLLESAYSEHISIGLLKSSVELDLVTESDITSLLTVCGDERDYEWYIEDQIGNFLSDKTIIRIDDILRISKDSIENILGYKI